MDKSVFKVSNGYGKERLDYVLACCKTYDIEILHVNEKECYVYCYTDEDTLKTKPVLKLKYEKLVGDKEHFRNDRKRIFVIHGLGGGETSKTSLVLKELLGNEYGIMSPEIPIEPFAAANFVFDFIKQYKPHLVIGTSLGGFYALRNYGAFKTLVINPAMKPYEDILNAPGLGKSVQEFRQPRHNGDKTFNIDDEFLRQLKVLQNRYEVAYDYTYAEETYAIFGNEDPLFSHISDYKKYYDENTIRIIEAGHSLTREQIIEHVIPYVKEILSK